MRRACQPPAPAPLGDSLALPWPYPPLRRGVGSVDAPDAPRRRTHRRSRARGRGARARRHGDRDPLARLARAEERARALAAARGVGLQPLAARTTRGASTACSIDRDAALAAAARRPPQRSPSWPRATATASPAKLAAALVAPRAGDRRAAARCATLERRAERTLTQGHLAQHLFFHSLHQFAIPSAAPDIFGVTDAAFRVLRRARAEPAGDRPAARPLARRTSRRGRSPSCASGSRAGVRGRRDDGRAGRLLLRRQLSQLPRWLDQARYNGPPPTTAARCRRCRATTRRTRRSPRDGRFVAYEAYRQKLPLAVKLGEIAVLRADLDAGDSRWSAASRRPTRPARAGLGLQPVDLRRRRAGSPTSRRRATRTSPSATAGSACCSAICTAPRPRRPRSSRTPAAPRSPDSKSAYNPVTSADGSTHGVPGRSRRPDGDHRPAWPAARASRRAARPSAAARYGDVYEPGLSADGSRVVFTLRLGAGERPGQRPRSEVRRPGSAQREDDRRERRGRAAPPRTGAISPDGRFVAFTARSAGAMRLFVRDIDRGTRCGSPPPRASRLTRWSPERRGGRVHARSRRPLPGRGLAAPRRARP